MAEDGKQKLYGYSMTGKDLYHIATRPKIHAIINFKSSDFFVIMDGFERKDLYFYNLQGMVHKVVLESNIYAYDVFYSEYYGGLILLDSYDEIVVLRYSWKASLNNPSCLSSATASAKYSFSNKWCGNNCAAGATFTSRGSCEFTNDSAFLVYLNTNPPNSLPTNKVGVELKLKAVESASQAEDSSSQGSSNNPESPKNPNDPNDTKNEDDPKKSTNTTQEEEAPKQKSTGKSGNGRLFPKSLVLATFISLIWLM